MADTLPKRLADDRPLWLPDLRERFARDEDAVPLILRVRSFDGATRDFAHRLPVRCGAAARDYLRATVYNTLSVLGGYEATFFLDPGETAARALVDELPEAFQLGAARRRGLGKPISIANRLARAFGTPPFAFVTRDMAEYAPAPTAAPDRAPLTGRLRALRGAAERTCCVGVDVGGTDVKLAASRQGRLVAVKEYDWNPASFTRAEELLEPILLLTRLLRACAASDGADGALRRALRRDAPLDEIAAAVSEAERRCDCAVLDAVGVSFPDVVLHDRIVGGETPKTDGLRRHAADYEAEFAKLGDLKNRLLALCRDGGRCHLCNDGSMAAFTAAVELACGDEPDAAARGVVAYSLGTDLGAGVLGADGTIPQLPLELYDVWVDLGSAQSAALPPEDLRATRNVNSGLPGARRYLGQEAAYRLAHALDPRLLDGFTEERDGVLRVRTEPDDLRKPCLEHLMRAAAGGDPGAGEVFRQIGRNLAVVSRELDYLLHPETDARWLFGRFVKSERCFALLREGFAEGAPRLRLENGGDALAETPLMRQLAARADATVAQFAQAVGAIYYALL